MFLGTSEYYVKGRVCHSQSLSAGIARTQLSRWVLRLKPDSQADIRQKYIRLGGNSHAFNVLCGKGDILK